MDTLIAAALDNARRMGIGHCVELDPRLLTPEQRIREYCLQDKCGNYGNHYMCPPHVGPLDDIAARLRQYQRGVLLQHSRPLDVRNDPVGLRQTKTELHRVVLQLEDFLRRQGVGDVWGIMGGSCALCDVCRASLSEPCPYPDEARTSLESLAVDVVTLLHGLGLDNRFHADRITWTGCVLF